MTEDAPTLLLSSTDLWQWTQAINAVGSLLARLSAQREDDGRLAHADDEHAARLHEARQHPPLRQMTEAEQAEWRRRVPAEFNIPHDGEKVTVWAAHIVDDRGEPTGEWGLQAHAWRKGKATASVHAVCRDAEDALAMAAHLRKHGTPEHLQRLNDLAAWGQGRFVTSRPPSNTVQLGAHAAPWLLSEDAWEAALRRHLSPTVADAIVIRDAAHPHHNAWRELHHLANEEVARVNADPERLALLVHRLPRWNDDIRNPAALAHWAITESRTSPTYISTVVGEQTAVAPMPPDHGSPPRLADVQTPDQALAWARNLDAADPEHRIEAKTGFGRWGSGVDKVLGRKFPGLVERATASAKTVSGTHKPSQAAKPDAAKLNNLAWQVEHLDPTKPTDRRAALLMLGRVPPVIDSLIAEKFGNVPYISAKLDRLYPDGLPAPEAADWSDSAYNHDAMATALAGTTDDPRTQVREDVDAARQARGIRGLAAHERAVAGSASRRAPANRRDVQPPPRQRRGS